MTTPTPVLTLAEAQAHLLESRASAEPLVQAKVDAAIAVAQNFLNRNIYGDEDALAAAVAGVPTTLATAKTTYDAAIVAAAALTDVLLRNEAMFMAYDALMQTFYECRKIARGIVVDAAIKSGILLIVGHLYENRQDVQNVTLALAIPQGSQYVLYPYRVGMGA